MKPPPRWLTDVLFVLLLAVVTFLVYQPAWHGGFIWDDDTHVTKPELRSVEGLGRIWFDPKATQQYYPLLHSAFWVQYQLWGDVTLGYHLVNIALHVVAATLVLLILRRLEVPGSYLAAAIFALHPVCVESVAWITELKNTLSAVFYLAAMLSYLRFDRTRGKPWYAVALALFVLGLLSKTVTATLPAALLVIFWWKRGRLGWKKDVLPLVPFLVLGAAAGIVTAWVERKLIGAEGAEFTFTLVERFLIAGRVVWFYLGKLFWPAELIFIYPRWQISQAIWWQYLFLLAAVALVVALWLLRRRTRAPLAALLFFGGTLFPVLGFFNVYPFRYSFVADHFQYLACLGIIALASGGVVMLLRRGNRWARAAGQAVCVALLAVLAVLSWRQTQMYGDLERLYRTTIDRNPDCWLAYNNLGLLLAGKAQGREAMKQYQEALRLNPDYPEAHNNLGIALAEAGQFDKAIEHFREALRVESYFPQAHNNLGRALVALGESLEKAGKVQQAIAHYKQAIRLQPDYVRPHQLLAWFLATREPADGGDPTEALRLAQRACELTEGRNTLSLEVLAAAYAAAHQFPNAVATAQEALRQAEAAGQGPWANDIRARLKLYRAGRPYREPKRTPEPAKP